MEENNQIEPMLYFGYGSNLDNADWTKWCHKRGRNPDGLKEIGPAWIDGYYLTFDYYSAFSRKCGAANLKWLAPGRAATPGALFKIDKETLDNLDIKEGHPNPKYYQREIVTAYTADGQAHQAYTYIHYASEDNFYPTSNEYEGFIRNGLERLDLTTDWLDSALKNVLEAKFDLVFVYGTLMEGMHRHSEMQGCTLVCEGTVQGELYQISDYPGLVKGNGTVKGELYRAADMFQIIQRLDWIECAGGSDPLFNRVIQEVTTEQGKFWAYTYHYAKPTDSFERIISGDWSSFNK